MARCNHCGDEIIEGSSFCGNCGAALDSQGSVPVAKRGSAVKPLLIGLGAGFFILISLIFLIAAIYGKIPGLGNHDFEGGTELILQAEGNITSEKMAQSAYVIEGRLDRLGVDTDVLQLNEKQISVKIPKDINADEVSGILRTAGLLEFKQVDQNLTTDYAADKMRQTQMPAGKELLFQYQRDDQGQILKDQNGEAKRTPVVVDKTALATGEIIDHAELGFDQYGKPKIDLSFTKAGAGRFTAITQQLATAGASTGQVQNLAIVIDGVVISAPTVKQKIEGDKAEITGNMPLEEVKEIVLLLQTGALPLKFVQVNKKIINNSGQPVATTAST